MGSCDYNDLMHVKAVLSNDGTSITIMKPSTMGYFLSKLDGIYKSERQDPDGKMEDIHKIAANSIKQSETCRIN